MTDVSLDPGSPTKFGQGNAQSSETDIHLEGSNCAAIGHSGTVGTASPVTADSQAANSDFRGMYASPGGFTRTDMHLHLWIRDLYPIRNKAIGGVSVYIANGTTGEALYYMTGIDDGYGGGWYHAVVNLDPTTRAAADLGSLPTANIDRVGYAGNISVSKGEDFLQNSYLDAIRRGTAGQGITFRGGATGDRLTFLDCVVADTSSYGLLRSINGALFIEGPITWGLAANDTYLQEELQTINFANFTTGGGTVAVVAKDYYRIVLADGTTSITNIDFIDVTLRGMSRNLPFRFTSNLGAGDAYTSLRTTYLFGETITLNTLCTSTDDKFIECELIVPGGITLTRPVFTNCDAITLTAANDLISGGSTALHNTAANIPFITTDDLANITNHAFVNTSGVGHAIEITATGTYAFVGNTFTGYGADASNAAAIYNNSGGLVTINISGGGGTPTFRNGTSASTVVNAGAVSTTITVLDARDNSVVENARVLVTCTATGDEPFEDTVTITRSGSTASVAHTAHGMANGDKVLIEGAVENEYNGVYAITNSSANAYDYTVSGTPATPATGTILATAVIIDGLTNASGVITDSRSYTSDQGITGNVRKSSATPFFKASPALSGTIDTADGLSITVQLGLDE